MRRWKLNVKVITIIINCSFTGVKYLKSAIIHRFPHTPSIRFHCITKQQQPCTESSDNSPRDFPLSHAKSVIQRESWQQTSRGQSLRYLWPHSIACEILLAVSAGAVPVKSCDRQGSLGREVGGVFRTGGPTSPRSLLLSLLSLTDSYVKQLSSAFAFLIDTSASSDPPPSSPQTAL